MGSRQIREKLKRPLKKVFETIKRQAKSGAKTKVNRSGGSTSGKDSIIDRFLSDNQVFYTNSNSLDLESRSEDEIQEFVNTVDESDEFERVNDLDDPRKMLSANERVIIEGTLQRTPLSKFNYILDENDMWDEVTDEEVDDQVILNQFQSAAGYFELKLDSGCQVVMHLSNQDIRTEPQPFREYTIFGEIDHVYQDGEKESYMEILEGSEDIKDRNERTQRDVELRQFANILSSIPPLGEVSKSDFYLSPPDIRITPLLVYQ